MGYSNCQRSFDEPYLVRADRVKVSGPDNTPLGESVTVPRIVVLFLIISELAQCRVVFAFWTQPFSKDT